MTQTKVFCDKCGELITQDRTQLKIATGPERNRRQSVDFCSTCAPELWAWVDVRPDGSVAPAANGQGRFLPT